MLTYADGVGVGEEGVLAATSAARFMGGTQVLRNKWSDAQWADVPDDEEEVLSLLALLVLYWCFTGTKCKY
jgi:hypothetical protein